jgi:hypothetical protein
MLSCQTRARADVREALVRVRELQQDQTKENSGAAVFVRVNALSDMDEV